MATLAQNLASLSSILEDLPPGFNHVAPKRLKRIAPLFFSDPEISVDVPCTNENVRGFLQRWLDEPLFRHHLNARYPVGKKAAAPLKPIIPQAPPMPDEDLLDRWSVSENSWFWVTYQVALFREGKKQARQAEEAALAAAFAELPLEYPQGTQVSDFTRKLWRLSASRATVQAVQSCKDQEEHWLLVKQAARHCVLVAAAITAAAAPRIQFGSMQGKGFRIPLIARAPRGTVEMATTEGSQMVAEDAVSSAPSLPQQQGLGRVLGESPGVSNAMTWQRDARQRWLNRRYNDVSSRDNIMRLADQQGITMDQARSAFSNSVEAVPSQKSLLPKLDKMYKRKHLFALRPSTRAEKTVDVVLSGTKSSDTTHFYFNPVSAEEVAHHAASGMTRVVIDALEVSITPTGMPGDDTDVTAVVTWAQQSDPQRAFIGSLSTFVGNGVARCVFFPGLELPYDCVHERHANRVLRVSIASTNSTLNEDISQCTVSVGVVRQHLGPGHDRTLDNSLYELQRSGANLRATQVGSAYAIVPQGNPILGQPSANVDLGGEQRLVHNGELNFALERCASSRLTIEGVSRPTIFRQNSGVTHEELRARAERQRKEPRHSICKAAVGQQELHQIAGRLNFEVPADVKKGQGIFQRQVRDMIYTFGGSTWHDWCAKGPFDTNIKFRLNLPMQPMCGVLFMVALDSYGVITPDQFKLGVPIALLGSLPNYIVSLDRNVLDLEFDLEKAMGHSWFSHDEPLANPNIIMCALSTNHVKFGGKWGGQLELYVKPRETESTYEFKTEPLVVWPPDSSCINRCRRTIFGGTWDVGQPFQRKKFSLNWADPILEDAYVVRDMLSALCLGHLGIKGKIRVELRTSAPAYLDVRYWVAIGKKLDEKNWNDNYKRPHGIIFKDGAVELGINSAFASAPLSLQEGEQGSEITELYICTVGGPACPEKTVSKFDMIMTVTPMIETIGISGDPSRFAWFTVEDFLEDIVTLNFHSNICDLKGSKCTVTMFSNSFSRLIAVTGLMEGLVNLEITWSFKVPLNEVKGSLIFSTGSRTGEISKIHTASRKSVPLFVGKAEVPFYIGNFAGPTHSGETRFLDNFFSLTVTSGKSIEEIQVVVVPQSVKFYGHSASVVAPTTGASTL